VPPSPAPLPPLELATRVGPGPSADPFEAYEREGADVRARIERMLPADWSYESKRVLDFGCGSGRVLRHFLQEARRGEFWGCDIDAPSVAWVQANLSPPLRAFVNDPAPPLPLDTETFDLVYATSVFTHIGAGWSAWLLELHRVLRPGGTLVASFLGAGMWEAMVGEPYREDEVGMATRGHWTGPDAAVFHSEWWLREHWGRAFAVDAVVRPPEGEITHSYVALRKRAVALDAEELERVAPDEPREVVALQTNVRLLRAELEVVVAGSAAAPSLRSLVTRRMSSSVPLRYLRRHSRWLRRPAGAQAPAPPHAARRRRRSGRRGRRGRPR
jgi:SAM-dependent methyltransferase